MILPLYGSLPTTAADSAKLAWGEMGPRAAAGNPNGKSKRARRGKRPRPQSFTARYDDQRGAASSAVASPSKQEAKRFRSSQALAADYKLAMARTSLAKRAIVKEPRIASRRHQLSTQELIEQARIIESSATALCAAIYRIEMPTRGLVYHGSTWSVSDVDQEVWNLFATSRCSHRGMQAAYDRGERKIRITIVERLGLFKESSHDPGFYAADPTALQSNNEVDRVEKRLQKRLEIYERKFMTARVRGILRVWRMQRLEPAFRSMCEHKRDLALRGRTAAAMQIQRAYRGHHARQTMRRLLDAHAQTVIACLMRKVSAKQRVTHCHYERQREMAATTIQCAVRKRQARHRLQIARQQRHIEDAAYIIQHAWKNHLAFGIARQAALARRQDRAARRIAGFMRIVAAKSRLAHLRLERAALRVQTRWRGFRGQVLAHFRRIQQEERHDAAITIQGMVRGRQARHVADRLRRARREHCAVRIQARWRARHAQLAYFLIQRERTRSARVIQRFYKAFAIQIALRNRQRDLAARRIQRAYRAKLRRIFNAARSIQRAWRFHKWYAARKSGAIRVQTFVRCVQTRRSYAEKRCAVMVIQRAVRVHAAHCMLSALRERRERLQGMPLCDECNDEVCGFYCRACQGKFCKACMRMIHSVLRDHEKAHLQSSVGVIFAVDWTRDHIAAAIRVQRAWRRRIVRIIHLAEKYKLSRRQNALMMAGMRWRLRVKRSRKARVIQALFRGHRARKLAAQRRRAAIQIQAAARGFLCRLSFLRYRDACTRLQAHQRGRLARRQYKCQREAIVKIQSVLRAWDERGWFLEQRGAAISIQTAARRWRTQASFLAKRRAAICIQALARGHFVRSSLRQKHAGATRIQALVRCFILRRAYQQKRAAAVRVQTAERGHRVRVAVHEKKGFIAAVNIAERRGRYRCAVKIQTAYRLHVARERAALKIQSAWRRNQGAYAAYLVRIGRTAAAANQNVGQIDASDRQYVDNNDDDDDDDGLECIWSRHWDSWNEVHFYFHKDSFETTFQKPNAYAEAESEREARRCMLREEMHERKFMLYEREQEKQRRLENDWSVHVDPESGAKYYENEHLGISTWERPEVLGPDPDEPLWKMYLHPALNRPFYVHRDTQEATWERPVEELGYEYTECWDFESNQPYWVSSVTGEWTYERPDELVPDAVKGKSSALSEDERQQALDNEANRQWFEAFDEESGRPYYYCWNAFTKTTEEIVWDKPDALKSAHDLWDEYYSAADQASYYVHKQTGETTWKKPW